MSNNKKISTLPPVTKKTVDKLDEKVAEYPVLRTISELSLSKMAHALNLENTMVIPTIGATINIDTAEFEEGKRRNGFELAIGCMFKNTDDYEGTLTTSIKHDNTVTQAYVPTVSGTSPILSLKPFQPSKFSLEDTVNTITTLLLNMKTDSAMQGVLKYLPEFKEEWDFGHWKDFIQKNKIEYETQIKYDTSTNKTYLSSKIYIDIHLTKKAEDRNYGDSLNNIHNEAKESLKSISKKSNEKNIVSKKSMEMNNENKKQELLPIFYTLMEDDITERVNEIMDVLKNVLDIASTSASIISALSSTNLLTLGIKTLIKKMITSTVNDLVGKGGISEVLNVLKEKIKDTMTEEYKEQIRKMNPLVSVGIGIQTELILNKEQSKEVKDAIVEISDNAKYSTLDVLKTGVNALTDKNNKPLSEDELFELTVREALEDIQPMQILPSSNILDNTNIDKVEDEFKCLSVNNSNKIVFKGTKLKEDFVSLKNSLMTPAEEFEEKVKEALENIEKSNLPYVLDISKCTIDIDTNPIEISDSHTTIEDRELII